MIGFDKRKCSPNRYFGSQFILLFRSSTMKKAYSFLFILILPALAFSQSLTVKGKLTDDKSTPVGFATVMLKTKDSSYGNTLTDTAGNFTLSAPAAGTYFLRITAIGFSELLTEPFELNAAAPVKDIASLKLKSESKDLANVTVTALRPTITQLADRMVVSIEGTAMAQGNTAYTLLSKAPGVFVDAEGNIQLNGSSGVTIMIDGRRSYLSARELRNMLESMPAENIKNIEIITNPSSKYDAEGTAGILNINLKKNTQQGINGSVYTNYSYNFYSQHNVSGGGNINFKSGRWNAFLSSDVGRRTGGRNATFTRIFRGTTDTYFDQTATGSYLNTGPPTLRAGADYTLNADHSIGFVAGYVTNTGKQEFLTDTYIGSVPGHPQQLIEADNYSSNTYRNFTGNLHYVGKLDTLGMTLSTDLDYVKITNRGEAFLNNYFTDLSSGTMTPDILYNNTPNGYDIYSARIDFTKPFSAKTKIEAGAKASSILSDNDYRFYFNNGHKVIDISRTNHFKYNEQIYAAYLNWHRTLSKKISMQVGLRAEQTQSLGNSITTGIKTKREYTDLFPSFFLQHAVSDNYGINYTYTRRLTRPNYGNLNPFRAYRDPYTWYEGNTGLRPEYTHVFTMAHSIKKTYFINLSYSHTEDAMSEIPIVFAEDTLTVYTTGNISTRHLASLNVIAPVKITKKWDTQNTVYLYYNGYTTNSNNGLLENDQVTFWAQSRHNFQLPKEIKMELTFMYRSAAAGGLYHMLPVHRVDLAFKKTVMKKKLDLTINANDIFKGFTYKWEADINGNVNNFDQYFRLRSVGASIRYNFSKGQKTNIKQRTTIDELNRM